jgi:hypothetical protein
MNKIEIYTLYCENITKEKCEENIRLAKTAIYMKIFINTIKTLCHKS